MYRQAIVKLASGVSMPIEEFDTPTTRSSTVSMSPVSDSRSPIPLDSEWVSTPLPTSKKESIDPPLTSIISKTEETANVHQMPAAAVKSVTPAPPQLPALSPDADKLDISFIVSGKKVDEAKPLPSLPIDNGVLEFPPLPASSTTSATTTPSIKVSSLGTGAKTTGKLGAKRLGATRVAATSNQVQKGSLDFAFLETDFDRVVSLNDTASTAPIHEQLPNTHAAATKLTFQSSVPSSTSGLGHDVNEVDKNKITKFSNAKGISSDDFFANDNEDSQSNKDKLRMYSNANAISSSDFFNENPSAPRNNIGRDESLGDFVGMLSSAVGSDIRKVGDTLLDRAYRAKEGMSYFVESFAGRR